MYVHMYIWLMYSFSISQNTQDHEICYTLHGKMLARGEFCLTIQVKGIGEEILANKLQSVHMINSFLVYLWILVRKSLLNSSQFTKFTNFPLKISMYGILWHTYVPMYIAFLCYTAYKDLSWPYLKHINSTYIHLSLIFQLSCQPMPSAVPVLSHVVTWVCTVAKNVTIKS